MGEVPEQVLAGLRARRPDLDPSTLVPVGLRRAGQGASQGFVDVGFSKFVVLPIVEPNGGDLGAHLAELADVVLPLQT